MIINCKDTFLSLGNQGGPIEIEDVGEDLDADFGENYSKLRGFTDCLCAVHRQSDQNLIF